MKPKSLDGGTYLLLEDEAFIGMAIREFLVAAGADDVVHVFTVEEALELVCSGKTRFEAAVLDVRLPGGSTCYDVAVELAERDVAIVFHSGHVQVDFVESFPNAVFCSKPASPDQITEALFTARRNLVAATG